MSHQQLAQAAPAMCVQKEPSLPVLTHGHRSALDRLGRAFAGPRAVAILIGESKSGASYLIDRFLAGIEGDVAVVRITEACSDAIAGMREVIHAIGFEPKDMSLADLENVFTSFLSYQRNNNRRTIICFEETQDCAWWVLDRVRRLVDLETKEKFGLLVILSGRPSLNELLIEPPFDAICAHAGQRIALAPFTLKRLLDSAGNFECPFLEHFNLNEQPFGLTPDPEFVFWSEQHAHAKSYMESTISLADGFVVITGDIGSGKTTVLQSFLGEFEDDIVYAVVSQTHLNPKQFLQAVLVEFGLKPFNKCKVELLDMLNMFLIEQYANGKKVILIIDEAQNLSKKVLEEIRMLSGIETHKEKVLRIILAGQPELRETLDSPTLKQLVQRIRLRFHIGPLDRREMCKYILHRLKIAGRENNDLIAHDAFAPIYRYTGGIPRLINMLCGTALQCAFVEDKQTADAEDVMSAVKELNGKNSRAYVRCVA